MTNRKIKDYHKNKLLLDVLTDNFKMLCTLLIILHECYPKKFYKLNVQRWLEEYVDTCNQMNEYERDGAYDYKMKQLCDACGIDDSRSMAIAKKNASQSYNIPNMIVLRDNVKLALVHTSLSFGIGRQRLENVISLMLERRYDDWRDRAHELGIEFNDDRDRLDYRKLKPKEDKPDTFKERNEALEKLNQYRAYVEYLSTQEQEE
ncbi:MAG: hypothetical protein IKP95_09270 [Ruminococcus sp.]|nr:hypothetical protein [Ruminococcus sp.]